MARGVVYIVAYDSVTNLSPTTRVDSAIVYPNPVSSILRVVERPDVAVLAVYNIQGERVDARVQSAGRSDDAAYTALDIQRLPTGIYWLEISVGTVHHTVPFIVGPH